MIGYHEYHVQQSEAVIRLCPPNQTAIFHARHQHTLTSVSLCFA